MTTELTSAVQVGLAQEAARIERELASLLEEMRTLLAVPEVAKVTAMLLMFPESVVNNAYGEASLGGYGAVFQELGLATVLSRVRGLVLNGFLDDSEPGTNYANYDMMEGWVLCSPKHDFAKPFFHRYVEHCPDPGLHLNADRAVEILLWHRKEAMGMAQWLWEEVDEDEFPLFEPNPFQQALRGLVEATCPAVYDEVAALVEGMTI